MIRNNHGAGSSNISNVRGQVIGNRIDNNGNSYHDDFDAWLNSYIPAHGIGVQAGYEADWNTQMVVEDNDIIHNGMDGIRILSHENRVQSNRVLDSGGFGIYVPYGLRNVFRDNVTGSSGILDLWDESGWQWEGIDGCLK